MNLKAEQQKQSKIKNTEERELNIKRTSVNCGATSTVLIYMELAFRKERTEVGIEKYVKK